MRSITASLRVPFLCCMILVFALAPVSFSTPAPAAEYITGTVIGVSGRIAGRSAPFTLIVNKFTSPEEVQQLNETIAAGGQDRLLDVLSKMDAGRIQVGNNVGVTANAIIATPQGDGSRKITVIYQRTIRLYELRAGTRSQDYKFGYAEIYLDRNSKGEGTLIPAAKIKLEGNNWVVEDFGEFPARIMGVQVRGAKKQG